jgi:hypothetical protein
MTTFDYTENDLRTPEGNNDLGSFAMFFQRMLYKEVIFPSDLVKPLDTWYGKQLYGVVDQVQNSIVPSRANLVNIPSAATPNLLALNFVVDAFEDLVAHMQKAVIIGVAKRNGTPLLTNMKAERGYVDPNSIYRQYLQQIYLNFVNSRKAQELEDMTNFDSYLSQMMTYLRQIATNVPVTKTAFMVSGMCSMVNSGLTICIDNGPAEEDAYKYQTFIDDPNFDFYLQAAKKFGLSVNKNMPWMLTADLFSDAILKYTNTYILPDGSLVGETNFFDAYYTPTYLTDITILRGLIVDVYKNFVAAKPLYETTRDPHHVHTRYRAPLPTHAHDLLTDKQMLYLYLDLRDNETANTLPATTTMKRNIRDVYSLRPDPSLTAVQNAAGYINGVYRDYIYDSSYLLTLDLFSNLGLDNPSTRGSMSTTGRITQSTY